jgi:hypothetical protein
MAGRASPRGGDHPPDPDFASHRGKVLHHPRGHSGRQQYCPHDGDCSFPHHEVPFLGSPESSSRDPHLMKHVIVIVNAALCAPEDNCRAPVMWCSRCTGLGVLVSVCWSRSDTSAAPGPRVVAGLVALRGRASVAVSRVRSRSRLPSDSRCSCGPPAAVPGRRPHLRAEHCSAPAHRVIPGWHRRACGAVGAEDRIRE